jgi:hypothetical protein
MAKRGAFQPNAFQTNAFQVFAPYDPCRLNAEMVKQNDYLAAQQSFTDAVALRRVMLAADIKYFSALITCSLIAGEPAEPNVVEGLAEATKRQVTDKDMR